MNLSRSGRLITVLDGSQHLVSEVGGKANGLDNLIDHGYPVPRAMVLTTAAYAEIISEHSLDLLVRDLQTSSIPGPHQIEAESAAIERCFLTAQLPADVSAAIDRLAVEMLDGGTVAVRSSATAEDLAEASFAGQYLSVLRVRSRQELEVAIRRCWASLWMPSARAYRARHHIRGHDLAMAVVVQSMVEPQWAGVVFTTDPHGRDHLLRIEAVEGDGESLVAGKVTPADFLVRKDNLAVVTNQQADPGFVEELARLAVRIERTRGSPQDIEWAYDDSGITLLQLRPITQPDTASCRNDGFDSSPFDGDTYTPHGVIEMLPGVVTPLLWTINAPMLENAFRSAFADLGGEVPASDRAIVARFNGRAALNLSAICQVAESLPGGSAAEVERQYLGREVSLDTPTNSSGVHLFAALRSRRVHQRISDEVELVARAAQIIADLGVALDDLPVQHLVAYRQRIRDLAWRGYAAEVAASSAAGATYRALELLLERWLPVSVAATWAQRLTRTAIDLSTVGGLRSIGLETVVRTEASPEIRRLLASDPCDHRVEIASLGLEGDRFLTTLDHAVQAMGSRTVFGDTTWAEDGLWIWRQLHLLAKDTTPERPRPPENGIDELVRLLSSQQKWRRLRILTGQFIDLRVRWLKRQVAETTRFLELRETAKDALLVLGGQERRTIVEAANRLVASRRIPAAELVQYLTDSELNDMLFGSSRVGVAELARRRSVGVDCRSSRPLPDDFTGRPEQAERQPRHHGPRIDGWATSPGQATGPVRIVSCLSDGEQLEDGDVLVAHSTDPSWTPLFLTAGAIVLETGGPLSHASIVAREFGLPAVLNVRNATELLQDAELVTVDGTAGYVERQQGGDT